MPMEPPELKQGVPTEETNDGLIIAWKDGLPDDPLERAQIEQILITAGLTSKFSSIKRLLDGDHDAAEEEIGRMDEEAAQTDAMEINKESAIFAAQAPPEDVPPGSAEALDKAKAERGMSGTANDRSPQPKKQPRGKKK